uniref:carbon-nitrogen hydrolase family protein n=1 Tax=Phocaeicola dorei TaxID=357276 RepID=UPI003FEFB660
METLKIALLQVLPKSTLEENLSKGLEYCRKAKGQGADIALFPEMWSIGYDMQRSINELKSSAITIESQFIESFRKLAEEIEMAIGITFLEQYEPLPRNTFCLIDKTGNIILTYAKVHTCVFGNECKLTAGEDFHVAELKTSQGTVKVGAMICFDREFPESARILMLKGAEIILVPNACLIGINRFAQLRSRAYENMVAVAMSNYPKGLFDCNGHSCVFDGIAYDSEAGERDMLVVQAKEHEEGIFMAELPIDKLRGYRNTEVLGNAYRHPSKYIQLVENHIEEPFIRDDYTT